MALGGSFTADDDHNYDWEVIGFGTDERWFDRSPSEETMNMHLGDVDWGMLIHVTRDDGGEDYMQIWGGWEDETALADAIQDAIDEGDYF